MGKYYDTEYPSTYNEEAREAFDEIRDIVRKAGGSTLIVENGSGYVLAEVPEVTDVQRTAEREYNYGGTHPLLLAFVAESKNVKGKAYRV